MLWSAEITNDPSRDFDLYVELLKDEESIGRLQHDENNILQLTVYGDETIAIPFYWLKEVAEHFEKGIKR